MRGWIELPLKCSWDERGYIPTRFQVSVICFVQESDPGVSSQLCGGGFLHNIALPVEEVLKRITEATA